MAYHYIKVPWPGHVAPVFNRWTPYSVYASLESNFRNRNCPADILILIDGTITYRVQGKYLWLFNQDSQGRYIDMASYGIFRFSEVDPSLSVKPVHSRQDWLPI